MPLETTVIGESKQTWALLGDYRILIPAFFAELQVTDKPPLHKLSAIPAGQMVFDVVIVKGLGTLDELKDYLQQGIRSYKPAKFEVGALELAGVVFDVIQMENPRALDDDERVRVELYAGIAGGDLFAFGITQLVPSETTAKVKALCLKMIEGALVNAARAK